jgi:PadR family transcriptional regulator, regulatory protein PadR
LSDLTDDQGMRKGTTHLLLLAVLAEEPRHGYAIAREVERRSHEALSLGEGALYPALRALERDKLVVGTWEVQPSGPARRVYTITDAGRQKLAKQVSAWETLVEAIGHVIKGAPHGQPA